MLDLEKLHRNIKYIKDHFVPFSVGVVACIAFILLLFKNDLIPLSCENYEGDWVTPDQPKETLKIDQDKGCTISGKIVGGSPQDLNGKVLKNGLLKMRVERHHGDCLQVLVVEAKKGRKNKQTFERNIIKIEGDCPSSSLKSNSKPPPAIYFKND